MNMDIRDYLNSKIEHHCLRLFENEHFPECVHAAMKQVELNLKKKLGIVDYIPAGKIIDERFSNSKGVCLKVPFGQDQQDNARLLFRGAFKYYRNYVAHEDANITKLMALRVMIIASELLDLLDACYLSLEEIGGLEEIKRIMEIRDNSAMEELLMFVEGQWIADDVCDGFFEDLARRGFGQNQYHKLFELNLMTYESDPCRNVDDDPLSLEEVGFFRLTDLGKDIVNRIRKEKA